MGVGIFESEEGACYKEREAARELNEEEVSGKDRKQYSI